MLDHTLTQITPVGKMSPEKIKFMIVEKAIRQFVRRMKGVDINTDGWDMHVIWYMPVGETGRLPLRCTMRLLASDYGLGVMIKPNEIWDDKGWDLNEMSPVEAAQKCVRWLDSNLP